jgi:ketosteroid isomerase-like protein
MDHRTFVEQMFARVDALDAQGFAACLTERASCQFGNNPVVTGRAEIEAFIGQLFAAIAGLRHELENCWSLGDRAFCNGHAVYVRKDGSELRVPWATISRFEDGKLAEYLVYSDTSRLFNQ